MKRIRVYAAALCLAALLTGCGDTGENLIQFGDRMVEAENLSEETLEWLTWYNSLPEEEQLKVSAIPPDLLTEAGIAGTEDAAAGG